MKRDMIVTVLLTFCLTATLFMVATTRSQEYDPWADLNGDGKIDILDVVGLTSIYGTTGDSTKNVNVVNWPVTNQETVFYSVTHSSASGYYNASGFSQMHITWYVADLSASESVSFEFYGLIRDPDGVPIQSVVAETWVATENDNKGAMTIPVPSETFHFYAGFASGTTARVHLAFYLTYA